MVSVHCSKTLTKTHLYHFFQDECFHLKHLKQEYGPVRTALLCLLSIHTSEVPFSCVANFQSLRMPEGCASQSPSHGCVCEGHCSSPRATSLTAVWPVISSPSSGQEPFHQPCRTFCVSLERGSYCDVCQASPNPTVPFHPLSSRITDASTTLLPPAPFAISSWKDAGGLTKGFLRFMQTYFTRGVIFIKAN